MNPARIAARVLLAVALLVVPPASTLAQPSAVVPAIATENAEIKSRIVAEEAALGQERAELARRKAALEQLEDRLRRIARHAELGAAGREFAVMVRSELRALPRAEQVAAATQRRQLTLERISDVSVRAETAALALADLDAAAGRRLAAAPAATEAEQRLRDEAEARARLAEQRELFERLHNLARDRQQTVLAIGRAESELVQRGTSARVELTRLLFWLPSPPERHLLADLGPSIAWMFSAARWQATAAVMVDAVERAPVYASAVVLISLTLLIFRARLQRRLAALAAHAAKQVDSRVGDAMKALAVTLALALPVPLLMWGAGGPLTALTDVPPFTLAFGVALEASARLLFSLLVVVWLLGPHGLAACHFGWNAVSVGHAERALRRFTLVFVPLIFLAALNGLDNAPYGNRETLARLLFVAAMVVLAVLLVRLFRRTGRLMQSVGESTPRSWVMRLYPAWYWALLVFPLGMSALAVAGYLTAAGYFFGRATLTLFLFVSAGVVYGLAALWVQVQHRALERGKVDPGDLLVAAMAGGTAGGEVAVVVPQKIDLARMGEQTRSLLDVTLTLLVLAGLWWIWTDAVPALSTFGEHALWSSPGDDKHPASVLTVADLFQAIVIVGITWVAVRNVGALLDTLLLQRLEFQADANYAIKVVSRYAITAIGVLLASNRLGIAWSDAQWLIAALGVGLGFGLQEIVANFVSGLIVLAERPVRIGDVVTVGDVTGTVSGIRARSTRVIDFDNKEVIIPNKAFITERVVNWTLSDPATRLLLKVGVAFGTDIPRVQQLMLDAVRSNPDVERSPPASVYFVGFGESSLDFEIRAFVAAYDLRLRVRHDIYAAIERVLRDNGIEIPFPQRDLHIRTAPGSGPSGAAGENRSAGPQPHPA